MTDKEEALARLRDVRAQINGLIGPVTFSNRQYQVLDHILVDLVKVQTYIEKH